MLYATVRQRKVHIKKPTAIVRNGVNVDTLVLEMDDEWAEMTSIKCIFSLIHSEGEIKKELLHTFGEEILVPWECLTKTGKLSVSCIGYVNNLQIMRTMKADSFWDVVLEGEDTGDEPLEATPTLYDQVIAAAGAANAAAAQATQASNELTQKAENGEFDGEDGLTPVVEVGSVQTGAEGSEAQVTNTGTFPNVVLNFTLPRGPRGLTGSVGPQGEPGMTPYIGANGNWWNGSDDTGSPSRGADGYTPQRGVDYWLPEDQAAIENANVSAINATNAATRANEAAKSAESVAASAANAADRATAAANATTAAVESANAAANTANVAAVEASNAAVSANQKANAANTAANAANNATNSANNAAGSASRAATAATNAAEAANTAAASAATAAGDATSAAVDANNAARSASTAENELRTAAANGDFDGAPFTYDMFTPEQLESLRGAKGDTGATGKGLDIKGTYASVSALTAAVTSPEQGDMYNVGTGAPFTIYMYDSSQGWVSQGQLQGAQGATYTPAVDASGNLSWTNDGGLANPATVNIKGIKGTDGSNGKDGVGVSSVKQTTTSTADGGNNVVTVTLTNGTTSTFSFKNGSKGSAGANGETPVKGVDYFTDADVQEVAQQTATILDGDYLKLSGGTMTGPLKITGGDGATAGKISIDHTNKGQITDGATATLFGFNSTTVLTLGHGSYDLQIRGNGARPTYNSNNLALTSDIPAPYTHPSYTAKSNGFYKITVDGLGHVSGTTAVAKSDITALGIPAQDTTYSAATTSAAGLMSASDKSKLDGIASGANNFTYTHPSTHPASMITGLATVATTGSYTNLSNIPSTFTPAAHNQAASTITSGTFDAARIPNLAASKITAGTFAGQVVANSSGQTAGSYVLRNSKLSSASENPTVNGQICWKYK